MTPLGGVHELDFAAETLQAGYRVPANRLAQLLRGAADCATVYESQLDEAESCGHLRVIADQIDAGQPYDPAGVAKLLSGAAERLRYYERLTNDSAQAERGKRW